MHWVKKDLLKTCKGAVCKKTEKKKEKRHPSHPLPPQTNRGGFQLFSSLVCYIDQNQISPKVREYNQYKYYTCF